MVSIQNRQRVTSLRRGETYHDGLVHRTMELPPPAGLIEDDGVGSVLRHEAVQMIRVLRVRDHCDGDRAHTR